MSYMEIFTQKFKLKNNRKTNKKLT